ncbi:two-component system regulatory protein YycI [Listeria sp. PSOL-1]|uniref:two-component system regulatory protein YycI n=1 Tax=Listeria sp. PSOL-1 TaxID=1844999 RepID=UPI0013D04980|nr:two-component system regulatory protein YycI [Listeria sp. PSOL-1]
MDWRKAEIIFIITFLVLDIFLAIMVFNEQLTNDPDKLSKDTLQDHLKSDNIKYPEGLSNGKQTGEVFTAIQTTFDDKKIPSQDNQKITLSTDRQTLLSVLTSPIKVEKKGEQKELNKFIESSVFHGDEYRFWRYDKKHSEIIYNQVIKDQPVFFDSRGQIKLKLNKNNEVISYRQTFLEEQDNLETKKNLVSSLEALESVYQHGDLKSDSEVKRSYFGYYTTVQLSSGDVYFPVWCFEVNYKKTTNYYLVNAKDGQVINKNLQE